MANWECCGAALPAHSTDARICSLECSCCPAGVEQKLEGRCPDCGGELLPRPRRPIELQTRNPASTRRVFNPAGCAKGTS